jgi:cellulose synthase/poly-beta-1,6-N-acetylglucosamine synthase-like glycosyltransferase
MFWIALLATVIALLTVLGTLELIFLTVGNWLPPLRPATVSAAPNSLAVVIPAHNEAANITNTIKSLLACTPPHATVSIVVIADNCTDNTAEVAQHAGAQVLIRQDEHKRGKGYALDEAFSHLLAQGIEAVIIIDADTLVEPHFLQAFETQFCQGAAALQCRYTVHNAQDSVRTQLLNLALLAFNVLRPRGRERWGLSVGISGNGFGLTRKTLESVPYTANSVVEDLEYHLALVRAGLRVQFVDNTTVKADMPVSGKGVATQRTRWEGGRFRMMQEHIPRLLLGVLQGQLRLLEPLLELCLLPLALHVFLLMILLPLPFLPTQLYALFALVVVIIHVMTALWVGGGTFKDAQVLLVAPFYILWKLMLLPRLFKSARKDATWVRTARQPDEKDEV